MKNSSNSNNNSKDNYDSTKNKNWLRQSPLPCLASEVPDLWLPSHNPWTSRPVADAQSEKHRKQALAEEPQIRG